MIYSTESGQYRGIWFDKEFKEKNLLDVYCTAKEGDEVHAYQNTSHSLGTIIFKADSLQQMIDITDHMDKYYRVEVEQ